MLFVQNTKPQLMTYTFDEAKENCPATVTLKILTQIELTHLARDRSLHSLAESIITVRRNELGKLKIALPSNLLKAKLASQNIRFALRDTAATTGSKGTPASTLIDEDVEITETTADDLAFILQTLQRAKSQNKEKNHSQPQQVPSHTATSASSKTKQRLADHLPAMRASFSKAKRTSKTLSRFEDQRRVQEEHNQDYRAKKRDQHTREKQDLIRFHTIQGQQREKTEQSA